MDVRGPFSPDTVFMRARAAAGEPGEFDVVIAMYHDQGLIPVKYLGVDKGVNVTLGSANTSHEPRPTARRSTSLVPGGLTRPA
jgi:4-hydroxy-L-threonine phosphate dehydrogenase PdxA